MELQGQLLEHWILRPALTSNKGQKEWEALYSASTHRRHQRQRICQLELQVLLEALVGAIA